VIPLGKAPELPIRKISEKFARDTSKSAEMDIRKRVHLIAESTIRLSYHFGPQNVDFSEMVVDKLDRDRAETDQVDDLEGKNMHKSRSSQVRVDEDYKHPGRAEMKEFLTELRDIEKATYIDIRKREADMLLQLNKLNEDKAQAKCEKTIYDIAAEQSEFNARDDALDNSKRTDSGKPDYLTPFLAGFNAGPLDEKQASQVKEECLNALKERLLERAVIIEKHLEAETQKLAQKQRNIIGRAASGGQVEAEEAWHKFHEEALFKIDILKDRLARHEEQAVTRYYAMVEQLNRDPRLAILRKRPGTMPAGIPES
jgi:hypothetical protein